MQIKLPYGKNFVRLGLGGVKAEFIQQPGRKSGRCNLKSEFRKALASPIGCLPFDRIFSASDTVAIVVPDKTRPNAFQVLLPPLLSALKKAGVRKNNIAFVLANGTHSLHTEAEKMTLLGRAIAAKHCVIDHDCRKKSGLAYIGATRRGTKCWVNKFVAEADKVITVGIVGYHYYAGYNGGRKLIMPGVAGYESIQQNHKLVLNPPKMGGKNPSAVNGVLRGNPVSEDMLEAAKMVGVDFSINVLLDARKRIVGIYAGDLDRAHARACKELDRLYHRKFRGLADCVIVSAGGHPRDVNYIQAHKSLEVAGRTLRPGGTMIAFAECPHGFGSQKIKEWFSIGDIKLIEKRLWRDFEVPGNTVHTSLLKSGRFKIYFYSSMAPAGVRLMQMAPLTSPRQAEEIIAQFKGKKVIVIPDGTAVMPMLKK